MSILPAPSNKEKTGLIVTIQITFEWKPYYEPGEAAAGEQAPRVRGQSEGTHNKSHCSPGYARGPSQELEITSRTFSGVKRRRRGRCLKKKMGVEVVQMAWEYSTAIQKLRIGLLSDPLLKLPMVWSSSVYENYLTVTFSLRNCLCIVWVNIFAFYGKTVECQYENVYSLWHESVLWVPERWVPNDLLYIEFLLVFKNNYNFAVLVSWIVLKRKLPFLLEILSKNSHRISKVVICNFPNGPFSRRSNFE